MKKLRKQAKELLQAAHKVYHYRRDVTSAERLKELDRSVGEVEGLLGGAEAEPLQAAMERLDGQLRRVGGKLYPKTFWSDNLEVALVAAILVIGVRTFFFQPFIIPTNSMYPTYSGMNSVVYAETDSSPGGAQVALNKLRLGANHFKLEAPQAGAVRIPVFSRADRSADDALRGRGVARFSVVKGRKWFGLLPAQKREYVFYVDDQPVPLRVPLEFNLDEVIRQAFFPQSESLIAVVLQQHSARQIDARSADPALQTPLRVEPGERVIEFDITLGDALFVDRLSYHFRRPQAGDPFVFRTRNIGGIEGGSNHYVDKYYIKRIGGVGGETLEIKDGALYADGQPRDEVEPFVRNAQREGEYLGYMNQNLLAEGRQLAIPAGKFVALGDNSGNSLDSRYWGFVPERAVIGKAIFIYYPFTSRWGLAE